MESTDFTGIHLNEGKQPRSEARRVSAKIVEAMKNEVLQEENDFMIVFLPTRIDPTSIREIISIEVSGEEWLLPLVTEILYALIYRMGYKKCHSKNWTLAMMALILDTRQMD